MWRYMGGLSPWFAQKARTKAGVAFDEWYAPWANEMARDELFGTSPFCETRYSKRELHGR